MLINKNLIKFHIYPYQMKDNKSEQTYQFKLRNRLHKILICQLVVFLIIYLISNQNGSTNIVYMQSKINNTSIDKQQIEQEYQPNFNKTFQQQKIDAFNPDKRLLYNIENMGKLFGKSQKFALPIKPSKIIQTLYPKIQRTLAGQKLESYGFKDKIQVGSVLDYSSITQTTDFWKLEQQLRDSFAYQLLQFNIDQNLQKPQQIIKLNTITSRDKLQQYLNKTQKQQRTSKFQSKLQFKLALTLAENETKNKQQTLQSEYFYSDLKYRIGQDNQQLPICIFTAEYNLFSKDQYHLYFESLQKLNYTNFHIVYVDDFSTDDSAYHIYEYLRKSNSRIKNRIKIIHNLQKLGAIGNMCFWIKKYCGENDIVVNIDGDDALLGRQAFQILNQIYRNQNYWYVYTKYAVFDPKSKYITSGYASQNLIFRTSHYRVAYDWYTSHTRTFRQKLWSLIPLYSFIQYHVDQKSGLAWPRFYTSTADMLQVFPLVQLAGNNRVKFINDFIYFYLGSAEGVAKNCYRQHELADEAKAKVKSPLKPLQNLDQKGEMTKNYLIKQSTIQLALKVYRKRKQCLQSLPK